jgi:S1-C subfamily serine protease
MLAWDLQMRHVERPWIAVDAIRIGADSSNDLVVSPNLYANSAPFQAEIRRGGGGFRLFDVASAGLWVNGRKVSEALLAPGDSFQLGLGGPQFRFRTCRDSEECKTLRFIVADSRALARAEQAPPLVSASLFVKFLVRDLIRNASRGARLTVVAVPLFSVALAAGVPVALYASYWTSRETRRAVGALSLGLREERVSREELAARLETERERVGRQQETVAGPQAERDRLRGALEQTERRMRLLEREAQAGERLIAQWAGGVALVQEALSLLDPQRRPIRYHGMDENGRPLRDSAGEPLMSPDGRGPVATAPFGGTAFLLSRDGLFLTNRHVVEPWRDDVDLAGLPAVGYTFQVARLRAFLPGIQAAVLLTLVSVSDGADLALVRGDLSGAPPPVLALDRSRRSLTPGRPVLLMGYPTGLEALLAKADPATVQRLMAADISDEYALVDRLAALGLIRPATTRGFLADVQRHQVTYDALTTSGGSGGPVLSTEGKVVAINYAVLRRFAGNSFGIPAQLAASLLDAAQRTR